MAQFNLLAPFAQPRPSGGGFLSSLLGGLNEQAVNNQAADAYAPLVESVYGAQGAAQAPGSPGGASPPGQIDRAAVLGLLQNPATREQGVALLMNGGRLPQPKSNLPSDLQEYQYAQQQGFKGSFLDYQTQLKSAGASRTSVNVNAGGDNKQVFDAVGKSYESANAAASGLNAIREARAAVDAGGIFGQGADLRLGLQKIGAALGVADVNPITNTETFQSTIAPQVAAMLKSTVGSTQISNADREFASKAAGGSITLDQSSISRLLNIMERAQRGIVESHNKRLDLVYPASNPNVQRERALFSVQVPDLQPMTPPAASPAAPARQPAAPEGAPAPKSKAEYDALPSGTRFVAPDGTVRTKP